MARMSAGVTSKATFARAEAFARTLASAAERRPARGPAQNVAAEWDAEWQAGALLGKLLARARLGTPRLTEARALELLREAGQDVDVFLDLKARQLLRIVLGVVEIPMGSRLADTEDSSLSASELEVIRTLKQVRDAQEPRILWVPRAETAELVDRHRIAHPATPALEDLVPKGALRPRALGGAEGFDLLPDSHQPRWEFLGARGGAQLWHSLLHAEGFADDLERLRHWLEVARAKRFDWSAPELMHRAGLERFLAAATSIVLSEPDLVGWNEEGDRLRYEIELGRIPSWRWAPPPEHRELTLTALTSWLDEILGRHRDLVFRHDARRQINSLIGTIVRYDAGEDHLVGCARIRALVTGGVERPHLLLMLPRLIASNRPDAIAWLCAVPETASYGLRLLSSLTLDCSWMDNPESRIKHTEFRRTAFWIEGFQLVLSPFNALDARAAAVAIDECLTPVAAAAMTSEYSNRRDAVAALEVERRLDSLFRELEGAVEGHVVVRNGYSIHPPLPSSIGRALFEIWDARARIVRQRGFSSFPLAELRNLFWLHGYVRASYHQHASLPPPGEVARSICEIYREELRRDRTTPDSPVFWLDDEADVARFAWPQVVDSLVDPSEYAQFLRPLSFQEQLDKEFGRYDEISTRYRAIDSWINRARLHLRLLIEVHEARSVRFESEPERLVQLEDAIGELILLGDLRDEATGEPALFRDPWALRRIKSKSLLDQTVRRMESFGVERRAGLLEAWIARTSGYLELLALAASFDDPRTRDRIKQKLEQLDLEQSLEAQHWFSHLEEMAADAAAVGLNDVAKQILAHGDKAVREHSYKEEWARTTFRIRLLIAVNERDLEAVDALIEPPHSDDFPRNKLGSKEFYRALILLDQKPEQAAEIFADLYTREPADRAPLIHLFAARIRLAARIEPMPERRQAVVQILRDLDALEAAVTQEERERFERFFRYNRLNALDVGAFYERFDELWATLPPYLQHYSDFRALHERREKQRAPRHYRAAEVAPYGSYVSGSILLNLSDVSLALEPPLPRDNDFSSLLRSLGSLTEVVDMKRAAHRRLRNPFLPGRPWPEGGRLPGRDGVLDELAHLVEQRRPTIVLGQRRAGKTSLLLHLRKRLQSTRDVRYVSLEGSDPIRTQNDLALAIEPELRKRPVKSAAQRLLAVAARDEIVFLIDEIAHLSQADGTVFAWLRALGQKARGLVLCGSQWDWARIVDRGARVSLGSSFGNDVTPVEVGPLSRGDAVAFLVGVADDRSHIDEGIAEHAIDRCGTWPFYLQVMGDGLYRADGPITTAVVDRVYQERLLRDFGAVFRSRWAELPERIIGLFVTTGGRELPDFEQLRAGDRTLMIDTGLCSVGGQWLEDRPFFDWIRSYAGIGEE